MASTAALPVGDIPLGRSTTIANGLNGARKSKPKSLSPTSGTIKNSQYKALISSLPSTSTAPLWEQMAALNPHLPTPKTIPHIWRYDDIRPQLVKAGRIVPEEKAERRVLMFVNPREDGMGKAPYTTDTLYAGLQLVNPGETAQAHRHTAVATRFIIEAPDSPTSSTENATQGPQTAFTAIQARRIPMHVHDLIVTPRWTWHEHGNRGKSPVIWLDGLDLPSFQHVPVHFVEHYADAKYPATEAQREHCAWVVPWLDMKAKLDENASSMGEPYVERRYSKPAGGEVSAVLGAMAARLRGGYTSPTKRETASAVWHVVQGTGWTEVDGERIDWNRGDTFAVPAWRKWRHGALGGKAGEVVYLYRFDDIPMLKALGWHRADGDDVEALADE